MANTNGREALIEHAQQYAQECLQRLESYKQVEREYRNAVRALKALGIEPPTKAATNGKAKPRVSREGAGKGTGYRVPGTTTIDKLAAVLKEYPAGLTMAQIVQHLKGAPSNSIVSALRGLKNRGHKIATERAGAGSPALRYKLSK